MKTAHVVDSKLLSLTAGLLVCLASASVAQAPVSTVTRLRVETYGSASTSNNYPWDNALAIELQVADDIGARVRVTGGFVGNTGMLLLSGMPAATALPSGGTLLVGPTITTVRGSFDDQGELSIPFEAVRPALEAGDVYVQGMHLAPVGGELAYQLTRGLKLHMATAVPQEPLPYDGPPATFMLVDQAGDGNAHRYQVLTSVTVPTGGYELNEVGVAVPEVTADQVLPRAMEVRLDLVAPSAGSVVPPIVTVLHEVVELGDNPEARIDVAIRQLVAGMPPERQFQLAAVLRRDF